MTTKPTYEELEQKVKELEKQVVLHRQMGDELTSETEEPNHSMVLENPHLVDDRYSIKDLIDIEDLRKILETFSRATGFTTGFVEYPSQEILIATGWRDVCTKFHRAFPESVKHCKESNIYLTEQLKELKELSIKPCENGLVDGATPIVIKGKHLASLFTGQILFEKLDMAWFKKQAKVYGYDSDPYLEALKKVPVVNEDQFRNALSFLKELAVTIAETGLHNLELREKSSKLKKEIIDRKRVEEALKESEKKYRVLIENAGEVVLVAQNGRFKFANRKVFDLLGYKPEELMGKPFVDFIHPEDKVTVAERHIKRLDGVHLPGVYPFRVIDRSGETKWVEINAIRIEWEGKPSTLSFLADITERKQAEEALRESHKHYQLIVENISNVVWTMDMNFHNTFVSPSVYQQRGYTPEEVKNQPLSERMAPNSIEKVLNLYDEKLKLIEAGDSEGWKPIEFEIEQPCKDGSTIWTTNTVRFLPGPDKQPASLLGTTNDITERNRAEQALLESEEKFRLLSEQSLLAIGIIQDGNIKYANEMYSRITGYSLDEIYEWAPYDYAKTIYKEDLPFVMEQSRKKQTGDKDVSTNYQLRGFTKAKDIVCWDLYSKTVIYHGRPADLFMLVDITERIKSEKDKKELEKQLQNAQKMEAIGTLASGVAHDFNNLLMAIQGRTSTMLMNKDGSHPDFEQLKGIEDHVESAADLTKQLLGVALGGKYELKPTNLNHLIKKQNQIFGRTKKEIIIGEKYQVDLWPVEIDRGQIEQVILNLYLNAGHAMPGGGDLYVETKNVTLEEDHVKPFSAEPGRYVEISVADTGVGMDKTTLERIFDPFFTTKEIGRGTGLGLASVYGIIKNHGGFIKVYSEKGHGTNFNVYLPASEKEVIDEKAPVGDTLMGSETVLFVDDEDMIIEITEEMLKRLGYKVLTARSGKEAIKIYEEDSERIDIVVLDMIMPDMGGGDTYDGLKMLNPKVKVLLSSGYSIDGQATEILDRGCNGFIQKPFKMKKFSEKLRNILTRNCIKQVSILAEVKRANTCITHPFDITAQT